MPNIEIYGFKRVCDSVYARHKRAVIDKQMQVIGLEKEAIV